MATATSKLTKRGSSVAMMEDDPTVGAVVSASGTGRAALYPRGDALSVCSKDSQSSLTAAEGKQRGICSCVNQIRRE